MIERDRVRGKILLTTNSSGLIASANAFICWILCLLFGAFGYASQEILPKLYSSPSSLRVLNGKELSWGMYITPDDTILRYFKEPLQVGRLQLTIQSCVENHYFKTQSLQDAQEKPISPGQRFLIREQLSDIYLASWLSACSKLACGAFEDASTAVPCDQYLALLAPAQLEIEGTYNLTQIEVWPTLVGRYSSKTSFILALSIPIRNVLRLLSTELLGGSLFGGFNAAEGENSLTQFFSDFSGTTDFIRRAVLQPKGIELDSRKSIFFVPKITVDGVVHIRSDIVPVSSLFGVRAAIPASGSACPWSLDSFVPDNLYSTQLVFFGNWIFRVTEKFFPYVLVGFFHQLPYNNLVPLQQIKNQNSCIFITQQFEKCKVEPFMRVDSVVPELADQQFYSHTNTRNGVSFGTGLQYFPSGQETVSVITDYRIIHQGSTITMPLNDVSPDVTVLPVRHEEFTTQVIRLSLTLIGDNYFSLFNIQMNMSNLTRQMRLAVCFGAAL